MLTLCFARGPGKNRPVLALAENCGSSQHTAGEYHLNSPTPTENRSTNDKPMSAIYADDDTHSSAPRSRNSVSQKLLHMSQPSPSTISARPPILSFLTESTHLVFANLALGTTIHNVAKELRTPASEGGCGVSIVSSTALPANDSVSFVVQFASIHEARIARAGWDGLHRDGLIVSIRPAPSSLLRTITLTLYPPEDCITDQFQENTSSPPGPGWSSRFMRDRSVERPSPYTDHPRPHNMSSRSIGHSPENESVTTMSLSQAPNFNSRRRPPDLRHLTQRKHKQTRRSERHDSSSPIGQDESSSSCPSQPRRHSPSRDSNHITKGYHNYLGFVRRKRHKLS
jgi:hypothetical protein